jgi:hypothetical protein
MSPRALSDDEREIVFTAAQPINRARRDAFFAYVAEELGKLAIIGLGNVARVCREVQARHFDPPLATESAAPRHQKPKAG